MRDEIMRDERGPVGRLVHERDNGRERAKRRRGEQQKGAKEKKEKERENGRGRQSR